MHLWTIQHAILKKSDPSKLETTANTLYICFVVCRRPEDIKDSRPVAICDASAPGSDVAAAMSAALAAAALVFKQADAAYAARCLKSARNMYRYVAAAAAAVWLHCQTCRSIALCIVSAAKALRLCIAALPQLTSLAWSQARQGSLRYDLHAKISPLRSLRSDFSAEIFPHLLCLPHPPACSFANSQRSLYWEKCSKDAQRYYPSHCYMDDLAWAAAWLNWATGEQQYLTEAAQ